MTSFPRFRQLLPLLALVLCAPAHSQVNNYATFDVTKNFADPSSLDVTVSLTCNTGLPVQQSYFLLGDGETVTFVVSNFPSGQLDCILTETVPPGHSASYDDSSVSSLNCEWVGVESDDAFTCVITNTLEEPQALFHVRKLFTDGTPGIVDIELSCLTGLPLVQSIYVPHGGGATFVVVGFTSGDLDCDMTETVPAGYAPNYDDGTPDSANCSWENLPHGAEVNCAIFNTPTSQDLDEDGIPNNQDNCPDVSNQSQEDFDGDRIGDACDDDIDGDQVPNNDDLCAMSPGPDLVDPDTGCSLAQLCPCEGPLGDQEPWDTQNDYIKCVKSNAKHLRKAGVIDKFEYNFLVKEAKASQCGL